MIVLGRGTLQERWAVVDGYRIFARVSERMQSAGVPPVVLVHGLGVSSRYMVPLACSVARYFPVYSPDLPGFGRSTRPKRMLSIAELGHVLLRWMDALAIERALVIGNSMGCQIMVETAALRQEALCAAVLLGPTMDKTAWHPLAHPWRLFRDQFYEPAALVPLQAFDYLNNGPLRTIQTFREALRHDMEGRIHLIGSPSVIIRGENDTIVSRQWVQQLAARLPGCETAEVPGAGHALNYNSPEAVTDWARTLATRVRIVR